MNRTENLLTVGAHHIVWGRVETYFLQDCFPLSVLTSLHSPNHINSTHRLNPLYTAIENPTVIVIKPVAIGISKWVIFMACWVAGNHHRIDRQPYLWRSPTNKGQRHLRNLWWWPAPKWICEPSDCRKWLDRTYELLYFDPIRSILNQNASDSRISRGKSKIDRRKSATWLAHKMKSREIAPVRDR